MNHLELAKLIASLLTPIVVAILGYWFNRRLKEIDSANQLRNQVYKEMKDKEDAEITRRHKPHIEFTIRADVHGPRQGFYIVEFVICAHNKSLIRHEFKEIALRVRGIGRDAPPALWEGHEPRLAFPDRLIKTDIKPENLNYIFVEPGVKQEISFVTRIAESYAYIIARAEFHYDSHTPHSIERMFAVNPTDTRSEKHPGQKEG